ncbi:MAG TPA: zinc ribbon domain-containing protein [Vicinamibacterales bacterium]|nr:zinc ribbon domain-containing protein [Vicinamibacterales bacterium]
MPAWTMSFETSTESRIPAGDLPAPGSDTLQPWQLFTLAGLVGATITVFLSRGQSPAGVILLSLTVFAAAAVGIAALRTFIPLTAKLLPESLQVLGGRTRAALEREKALVLRSIKELEFDRAMGKVSEKDFNEMSARLRARATGLMRQIDAGAGYRQQIEKEIERRIGAAPVRAGSTTQDPAYVAKEDQASADVGRVLPSRPAGFCTSCGTAHDADARFCKECGANLRAV